MVFAERGDDAGGDRRRSGAISQEAAAVVKERAVVVIGRDGGCATRKCYGQQNDATKEKGNDGKLNKNGMIIPSIHGWNDNSTKMGERPFL